MSTAKLERTTFETSRLLEFCSKKELIAQIGHEPDEWPRVVLKECLDNALDACEEAGTPPKITIMVDASGITVADNGPGIPAKTIDGVLDYKVRASSREAYVSPDRGAQGNALKCLTAMPFVLDGDRGRVDIEAHGQRHEITFSVDQIRQKPVISRDIVPGNVKTGTSLTVRWPDSACSILSDAETEFLQLANNFTFLNPHLTLIVKWFGREIRTEATDQGWKKWRPSDPTSSHWYAQDHLEWLIAAYISHDRDNGIDRSVREVVKEFRGLTGSAKQRLILETTGLARTNLSALVNGEGLDRDLVAKLLGAMQQHSKPVKPAQLGIIGKDHLARQFESDGCDMDTFRYKKILDVNESDIPIVLETAFACFLDEDKSRRLITGTNWSPGIVNPFRRLGGEYGDGLDALLERQKADWINPIAFLAHCACPRLQYTDRGKSAVVVDRHLGRFTKRATESVTASWAKQIRAEERNAQQRARRRDAMKAKPQKVSLKEAAWQVMPAAYAHASSDGKYPANTRQIMYPARGPILRLTGKEKLGSSYFSQTLLPDYVECHPEAANWDVVYDARGHLREPHTNREVKLGTLEVRRYLAAMHAIRVGESVSAVDFMANAIVPTCGPAGRFGAGVFIEKEGWMEQFRAAKLAERYDIAIMSTKGMSVTACRHLADEMCGKYGIPLFVLHDFDKAGFSILGTLRRDTRRYRFKNEIQVIDLGLRLDDVKAHSLESETVYYQSDPIANLIENRATEQEIDFLLRDKDQTYGPGGKVVFRGERIELNAFTTESLIKFIESKLEEHGVKKVIPGCDVLESAYRRASKVELVIARTTKITRDVDREVQNMKVPKDLEKIIRKQLRQDQALSWDQAVAKVAARNCKTQTGK